MCRVWLRNGGILFDSGLRRFVLEENVKETYLFMVNVGCFQEVFERRIKMNLLT